MAATVPTHCPHGAEYSHIAGGDWASGPLGYRYEDGCRTTASTCGPRLYWCGYGEMSKPNGVSVTEGEYLAAWDDAINEALAMNHLHNDETFEALAQAKSSYKGRMIISLDHAEALIERDHAEALTLNAGDELYDEAVRLNETRWDLEGWPTVAEAATEHAEYLTEAPWSDRVND